MTCKRIPAAHGAAAAAVSVKLVLILFWLTGCGGGTGVPGPSAGVAGGGGATEQAAAAQSAPSPQQAVELLQAGNERFVQGRLAAKDLSAGRRQSLAAGQKPFAVVVCCSDSRVPPELVFDQGLGELFVVRVAGNVIDPVVRGSVEYAVEHLHAPLVVVLGHEDCGAVKAAVEGGEAPGEIGSIIERITPSVREVSGRGLSGARAVGVVTDLNVIAGVEAVLASPVVSHLEHEHKVAVMGAKYRLASGRVEWFERPGAK
jgi:carbonic anhydrase